MPPLAALFPIVTNVPNIVILWHMSPTQGQIVVVSCKRQVLTKPPSAHFDTSLSTPVRKYLQTYGLTPPRVESYEEQKKRCLSQEDVGKNLCMIDDQ
jgi:hypothetical protein